MQSNSPTIIGAGVLLSGRGLELRLLCPTA